MNSKLILLITGCVFFVSCKKNYVEEKSEPAEKDVTVLYKEIATQILVTAKANENFRTIVYSECNKQKYGDYYVKLKELIELNANTHFWDAVTVVSLTTSEAAITQETGRDVIIFVPSIEKHPEKAGLPAANIVGPVMNGLAAQEPVAVIANEYVPSDQTSRGYVVNHNGVLEFFQTIDESYAWENDIWVIGEEENVSPGNMVDAVEDTLLNPGRTQGQSEYAGLIQITNIGEIEPWVSGKLEFVLNVFKADGSIALGSIDLGKVKRKYFENWKWYDYNKFVGNWHTSTFGNYMYEHWLEEDGGSSNPITFTLPPPAGTPGATVSVTIPAKDRDDDLGKTIIQFTDPITQVYTISHANIKRRN